AADLCRKHRVSPSRADLRRGGLEPEMRPVASGGWIETAEPADTLPYPKVTIRLPSTRMPDPHLLSEPTATRACIQPAEVRKVDPEPIRVPTRGKGYRRGGLLDSARRAAERDPRRTLGIYCFVWYYNVNREMSDLGRARGTAELGDSPGTSLLAVTLGALIIVPAIVSLYNTFQRTQTAARLTGVEPLNGWIALILYLLLG